MTKASIKHLNKRELRRKPEEIQGSIKAELKADIETAKQREEKAFRATNKHKRTKHRAKLRAEKMMTRETSLIEDVDSSIEEDGEVAGS